MSRLQETSEVKALFKLLNRNNYEKGGWVLHMLRRVVGDEKFFAGVADSPRIPAPPVRRRTSAARKNNCHARAEPSPGARPMWQSHSNAPTPCGMNTATTQREM